MSRPSRHHYPLLAVSLSLLMLTRLQLSYRACAAVLAAFARWCPAGLPCPGTARRWLLRLGLWLLRRPLPAAAGGWVVIVDHTVQLGQRKCLAVLGIPVAAWRSLGRPLSHPDVTLLALEVHEGCNGEQVGQALRRVHKRVGQIAQVVSDHGADLLKGIACLRQEHPEVIATYDVRHLLACLLKAELAPDERWQGLLRQCNQALPSLRQTAGNFLRPPSLGNKARYLKVARVIRWAAALLGWARRGAWGRLGGLLGKSAAAARAWFTKKLGWLHGYAAEVAEYEGLLRVVELAQDEVGRHGLSRHSAGRFWRRWRAGAGAASARVIRFAARVRLRLAAQAEAVPAGQTLPGSSDVIESVFGKFKELAQKSPGVELEANVLLLGLLAAPLSAREIKEGLEATPMAEVDAWVAQHIGPTGQTRKRRLLGLPGPPPEGTDTAPKRA